MSNVRKIELLSPAGNHDALLAGLRNGADAVYLGVGNFNARKYADNFDNEGLIQAIDLTHERGKKLYLTLNTLLTENELVDALRLAEFSHKEGIDAIIIQDIGLAGLLHQEKKGVREHEQ